MDSEKNIKNIFEELRDSKQLNPARIDRILKKYPKQDGSIFPRDEIISLLRLHIKDSKLPKVISALRLKPTRTISGVTTVTVLTKPFACPGKCIFCPNDVRMPKSYIANEPGAQRALMNRFSPYLQVSNRLTALKNIGHPTDKIELLILGGTWSYYPLSYRIWFIHECFRAMNDFGSDMVSAKDIPLTAQELKEYLAEDFNNTLRLKTGNKPYNQLIQTKEFKDHFDKFIVKENSVNFDELFRVQDINSRSNTRCVGLVLETRPDTITPEEVLNLRKFGATKIQLGIQTLDDQVSKANKRGESKNDVINAFALLRAGGFKIHAHIMPNLLGATPKTDLEVYRELFDSKDFRPDELKIYPTSVIKNTELYTAWQNGEYKPYTVDELVDLVANCVEYTPEYCRLTRIIRDIPSTEIETGNKTTNLREVVEFKLKKEGRVDKNIRAREVKDKFVGEMSELTLDEIVYQTTVSTEYFLQYIGKNREIAGFLRLSLPNNTDNPVTEELDNSAIIREVHVYGPSLRLSEGSEGQAQHLGLGTKLIERAKKIASEEGFERLAVISSIGTREYYSKRGFVLGDLYQVCEL